MAQMGDGYGSEYHLRKLLDQHRGGLIERVKCVTGTHWADFQNNRSPEGEYERLDFLPENSRARRRWKDFWPPRGKQQNWDAVGRILVEDRWEWLLVEAKAHLDELKNSCKATEKGGRPKIRKALNQTKNELGVQKSADWLNDYYQHANRIAALNFMIQNNEPGRLLFVYFCGDKVPDKKCPEDQEGWSAALSRQDDHLGLSRGHTLADRVHKIFVPVTNVAPV